MFPSTLSADMLIRHNTVSGWDVVGASEHFVVKVYVLEAGKMEA